jgi:hypothetical protein
MKESVKISDYRYKWRRGGFVWEFKDEYCKCLNQGASSYEEYYELKQVSSTHILAQAFF